MCRKAMFSILVAVVVLFSSCKDEYVPYEESGLTPGLLTADGSACERDSDCPDGYYCTDEGVCCLKGESKDDPDSTDACDGVDCDDDNVCTHDTCDDGVCFYTNVDGACDDGDRLTIGDHCVGGECLGTKVDCVDDSDCFEGKVCVDNVCVVDIECIIDVDCPSGEQCVDGVCVEIPDECTFNSECGSGEICVDGKCVPDGSVCTTDADCDSGSDYILGQCVNGDCVYTAIDCTSDGECPDDGNPCTLEKCVGGFCQTSNVVGCVFECSDDDDCAYDKPSDSCMGGDLWVYTYQCKNWKCVYPHEVVDCPYGCAYGQCKDPDCTSDSECDDGKDSTLDECVNYICQHTVVQCTVDSQCTSPPNDTCSGDQAWHYLPLGSCVGNSCQYSYDVETCDYDCENGECVGECSYDSQCTNVPDSVCVGSAKKVYSADCQNGFCSYPSDIISCQYGCEDGECVEAVCQTDADCNDGNPYTTDQCIDGECYHFEQECVYNSDCKSIPAPVCVGSSLKTYYADCVGGQCTYPSYVTGCTYGCENGACVDEPSECVVDADCKAVPSPQCDGSYLETFYADCVDGECLYPSYSQYCEDGCSGGSCNQGPVVETVNFTAYCPSGGFVTWGDQWKYSQYTMASWDNGQSVSLKVSSLCKWVEPSIAFNCDDYISFSTSMDADVGFSVDYDFYDDEGTGSKVLIIFDVQCPDE